MLARRSSRVIEVVLGDISVDKTLRLHYYRVDKAATAFLVHAFGQGVHALERGGVVVAARILAAEYVAVEIGKFGAVEIKVGSAVGVGIFQLCACPVEHGHEVVAHGAHAGASQVLEACLIVLYKRVAVGTGIFYRLADRQTFHHRPAQTGAFDDVLHAVHLVERPHLSVGDVVQSRDYAFHAYLAQHFQCDLILGAKPPPGLFHCYDF